MGVDKGCDLPRSRAAVKWHPEPRLPRWPGAPRSVPMPLPNANANAVMQPIVDHIQITVRDLDAAVPFYDRLMPLLGFDPQRRVSATIAAHDFRVVEYAHPRLAFAITSPRAAFAAEAVHRRRPGALHHLAFRAESRAEVDRMHDALVEIGAVIVEPPRLYPEHGPNYYALFFKDLEGIKLEIVHSERATA